MMIDANGMLWVAVWGSGKIIQYDPDIGRKLSIIKVPTPYVSSVRFAGSALEELIITTSGEGLNDKYAGRIYTANVGTHGLKCNKANLNRIHS